MTHETYYNEEIVDNICDAINIADPTNTFRTPEDIYNLLADLIDPTCYLECIETTPKGAEEWELDWEWQCSNCGENLTDRYDDLDIKTPEPLKNASSVKSMNTVISLLKLKKALMKRNYMAITTHQSPH